MLPGLCVPWNMIPWEVHMLPGLCVPWNMIPWEVHMLPGLCVPWNMIPWEVHMLPGLCMPWNLIPWEVHMLPGLCMPWNLIPWEVHMLPGQCMPWNLISWEVHMLPGQCMPWNLIPQSTSLQAFCCACWAHLQTAILSAVSGQPPVASTHATPQVTAGCMAASWQRPGGFTSTQSVTRPAVLAESLSRFVQLPTSSALCLHMSLPALGETGPGQGGSRHCPLLSMMYLR